ncbi:unnamed protein product, partial [Trichogramma brassicae]
MICGHGRSEKLRCAKSEAVAYASTGQTASRLRRRDHSRHRALQLEWSISGRVSLSVANFAFAVPADCRLHSAAKRAEGIRAWRRNRRIISGAAAQIRWWSSA